MFEFRIRAAEQDPTGYYVTRWDLAENITVKAETKAAAFNKVKGVLGDVGRYGWRWAMTVDGIKEI